MLLQVVYRTVKPMISTFPYHFRRPATTLRLPAPLTSSIASRSHATRWYSPLAPLYRNSRPPLHTTAVTSARRSMWWRVNETSNLSMASDTGFHLWRRVARPTKYLAAFIALYYGTAFILEFASGFIFAMSWPADLRQDAIGYLETFTSGLEPTALGVRKVHLRRMFHSIISRPIEDLGRQPLIKIMSVTIWLIGILEIQETWPEAYEVAKYALTYLMAAEKAGPLTRLEREAVMPIAVAIVQNNRKLGLPDKNIQHFCVWATEIEKSLDISAPCEAEPIVSEVSEEVTDTDGYRDAFSNSTNLLIGSESEYYDWDDQFVLWSLRFGLPWEIFVDSLYPLHRIIFESLATSYARDDQFSKSLPLWKRVMQLWKPPAGACRTTEGCYGSFVKSLLAVATLTTAPTPCPKEEAKNIFSQVLAYLEAGILELPTPELGSEIEDPSICVITEENLFAVLTDVLKLINRYGVSREAYDKIHALARKKGVPPDILAKLFAMPPENSSLCIVEKIEM